MPIERIIVSEDHYENAYQCMKDGGCPQRSGPKGCPKWWSISGKTKDPAPRDVILEGCIDSQQMLGRFLEDALEMKAAGLDNFDKFKEDALNRIGTVAANNLGHLHREYLRSLEDMSELPGKD